jgi:16S rRNA G1207 methylase RsmC
MSKLTKQQAALHTQACVLLQKDCLSFDERLFVLTHWQEGANHVNGMSGAFFTPQGLATDFAIEVSGHKVIDLCAGIGSLAFAVYHHNCMSSAARPKITCVEVNPDYVAVGKKVLPEATWIVADVLDLPGSLTGYHVAIANPPLEGSSTKATPRVTPAPNSSTR